MTCPACGSTLVWVQTAQGYLLFCSNCDCCKHETPATYPELEKSAVEELRKKLAHDPR